MAEYGEWNKKEGTLSDVTAKAEYSVSQDFIVKGIQIGKLEYREGSVWGNPYLRILRSQLEKYIADDLGEDYLLRAKNQTELRKVKKEISDLKKTIEGLQDRKKKLESLLGKSPNNRFRADDDNIPAEHRAMPDRNGKPRTT